jgi:hypothetical protein
MMFLMLDLEPGFMKYLTRGWQNDRMALVDYDRGETVWGVREYFPNYAAIPRKCDTAGARRATYPELRKGVGAQAPFLLVRNGPVGLVEYAVNGTPLQPSACNEDLVLGPLPPGRPYGFGSEDQLAELQPGRRLLRGPGVDLVGHSLRAAEVPSPEFERRSPPDRPSPRRHRARGLMFGTLRQPGLRPRRNDGARAAPSAS